MSVVDQIESKQAILDAAEQLLTRHGYAGLSMRELSRHSGLAKSTLYHYFQDKHEIYLSVLERDMLIFEEHITQAARSEGDVIARMRAVIRTYFALVTERGSLALNALRRAGELDGQLVDLFNRHRDRMLQPMGALIQEGIDGGVFRPVNVELTIISLLGMTNGFAAHRLLYECTAGELGTINASADEIVEHTVALFMQGLQR